MKMAKAPKDEWESVMRFAQELEDEIKYRNMTDEELGAWVRKAPCLFRVVFGYQVLVDNCADPNLDYLDFKPEIKAALDGTQRGRDAEATTATETRTRPSLKGLVQQNFMNAIKLYHQDGKPSGVFYCEKCRCVKRTEEEANERSSSLTGWPQAHKTL